MNLDWEPTQGSGAPLFMVVLSILFILGCVVAFLVA